MVMACLSVHRRDDTLDSVQCPKTRQDYTCIYHYTRYNTRTLSAGTYFYYSHQLYKHTSTRYVAISVKSKHVLKIKPGSVIAHNVTLYTMLGKNLNASKPSNY